MQLQQTAILAACLAALASGVAADKCTLENAVNSPAQLDNDFKKFGAAVTEVALKIAPVEITTGKLNRRQLGSEVPLDCQKAKDEKCVKFDGTEFCLNEKTGVARMPDITVTLKTGAYELADGSKGNYLEGKTDALQKYMSKSLEASKAELEKEILSNLGSILPSASASAKPSAAAPSGASGSAVPTGAAAPAAAASGSKAPVPPPASSAAAPSQSQDAAGAAGRVESGVMVALAAAVGVLVAVVV